MNNYKIIKFGLHSNSENIFKLSITSSTKDIYSFINLLNNEIQTNNPDFSKLKKYSYELICRLPIPLQLLQDNFILRSRENINGELFNSSSEISYNSCTDKINLGRFNLKGESVFYGALPLKTENSSGEITTICESCKELFDSDSKSTTKYFTVGKWNILRPIRIVVLTFCNEVGYKNIHIQKMNPEYQNFLTSIFSKEDYEKYYRFITFFSEYASNKYDYTKHYLLTTAFFHSLKEYYGTDIGILYSSSMTENFGLNIVLTKELIDSNYLKFEFVAMFKAVRDKHMAKSYNIYPCTNLGDANEDGNFRFDYLT